MQLMACYGEWVVISTHDCRKCLTGTVIVEEREVVAVLAPVSYDREWRERKSKDTQSICNGCGDGDFEPADLSD
jgi:hypothetical protein